MAAPKSNAGATSDFVYLIALGVSSLAFVISITLVLERPIILHKLAIPLAVSIYSSDGMITQKGVNQLEALLITLVPLTSLIGCLTLCYGLLWRYFSRHLPAGQPDTPGWLTESVTVLEFCSLLMTLVIALIFRLHGTALTRGLTYDEIYTAMNYVDADSIWTTLSSYLTFNNHIAYSILARFSQSIFGRSEWSLRLPALLLGLASLCFFWAFIRRFLGSRLAIIATFCLALSPPHVIWSTVARGYSGMILFTMISSFVYLKLLRTPSLRDALIFIVASVIGIYFHLYAAFVTMVQILFLTYLAKGQVTRVSEGALSRESFRLLWLSFAAIAGLLLVCYATVIPQLIVLLKETEPGTFNPLFPVFVLRELSGYSGRPLMAVIFFLSVWGFISLRLSHSNEVCYFLLLLILPLPIVWISRPYHLYPRFFAYFLPYFILFLVSGFSVLWAFRSQVRTRSYFIRILPTVLGASVLYTWSVISWKNMADNGFREAARAMNEAVTQSPALCAIGSGADLYQYYSERTILLPANMEEFRDIEKAYSQIRCAYLDIRHPGPRTHKEIRDFLLANADSHRFNDSVVFSYPRGKH